MKLYLLSTKNVGDYYVAARNTEEAEVKLKTLLNADNYGFSGDRRVMNIKFLAEEIEKFNDKPFFSSGHNFILPTTCD